MVEQVQTTPEESTHGAPALPAAEAATRAEAEARAKAAAAAEGVEETHTPEDKSKKDGKVEEKPAPKTYTQEELDAEIAKSKEAAAAEWSGEEYIDTGNQSAQDVIELLKEAGVSPKDANSYFEEAIKTGDLSKVNWTGLEEKLGPHKARLAKNGIMTFHNEVYTKQQETVEAVYKETGGEEGWVAIRDWAQQKEKTDPVFGKSVKEYRKALELGGFAATAAVRALKEAYQADPNTTGLDNTNIEHGSTTPAPVGGPLTKQEYLKARHEAEANNATEREIAALAARRKAGIARERTQR